MTCLFCGAKLVDGVCWVKHCKAYGNKLKQILAEGKLPFGQSISGFGISVSKRK